jgi:Animal haem peroxidase
MNQLSTGSGQTGRHPSRNHLDSLSRNDDPGMFGRIFPYLPPHTASDEAFVALAHAMKDTGSGPSSDNFRVPAGFTYFAQFIEHDITLDCTSIGERCRDPLAIENFRTPSLDLDSLYGCGPDCSPHLYARNPDDGNRPGPKFLIGTTAQAFRNFGNVPACLPNDLPRNSEGLALIADHRNDENLVLAQLHLAWLKFHNKVVDTLDHDRLSSAELFEQARQLVTWHYQWLVLHDFVARITAPGSLEKALHEGRRHYRFCRVPYLPVEFFAAAFQLGPTMVRETYSHNRIFSPDGEPAVPATPRMLNTFTGRAGGIVGKLSPEPLTAPAPLSVLSSNWIIDWRRYFDFGTPAQPRFRFNHSRQLDPFIAASLHDRPQAGGNIALKTLQRGVLLGLPSGQDIAAAMKISDPLTPDEIASGPDGRVAKQHDLHLDTPLWFYILKEAQQRGGGERLGPVGAGIVAEVFVGLVEGDGESYLGQQPDWTPTLPSRRAGTFTMTDLLQLVGDISPVDGITHVAMR